MTDTHSLPRGLSVLVVEDDASQAGALKTFLELSGHRVRVAGDGAEALRAAELSPPDVALLDIALPGMDGDQVARRLREVRAERRPLLVAVSGLGADEDLRRSFREGLDMHWVKPTDPEKLLALLGRFAEVLAPPP